MSVYKRGDRWHYRFQAGGQRYSGSAGPGAGKASAVALEAKMRADLLTGRLGTTPEHSVDEAILRWVSGEASRLRSRRTIASQVKAITEHTAGKSLSQIVLVAESVK